MSNSNYTINDSIEGFKVNLARLKQSLPETHPIHSITDPFPDKAEPEKSEPIDCFELKDKFMRMSPRTTAMYSLLMNEIKKTIIKARFDGDDILVSRLLVLRNSMYQHRPIDYFGKSNKAFTL